MVPRHVGYSLILPVNIGKSKDIRTVPITSLKHKPLGQIQGELVHENTESDSNKDIVPRHVGYSLMLPINMRKSKDKRTVPITSLKHKPLGQIQGELVHENTESENNKDMVPQHVGYSLMLPVYIGKSKDIRTVPITSLKHKPLGQIQAESVLHVGYCLMLPVNIGKSKDIRTVPITSLKHKPLGQIQAESVLHVGYCLMLPVNIGKSKDIRTVPITSLKHKPLGQIQGELKLQMVWLMLENS